MSVERKKAINIQNGKLPHQILNFLALNGQTQYSVLLLAFGHNRKTEWVASPRLSFDSALKKLVDQGLVERVSRGLYVRTKNPINILY